jgi:hypothetical protein
MSQYDEFAVNYHWLYSDYVFKGKPYLEEHKDVLKDAGPIVSGLAAIPSVATVPLLRLRITP